MVPLAALVGLWAATQSPAPVTNQWIQPANGPWPRYSIAVTPLDETMHYFLVVTKKPDGSLQAFVRNPESNAGSSLGTRTLLVDDGKLLFRCPGQPDVAGSTAGDTLTIGFPTREAVLTFHRVSPQELRWYFPRATSSWTYRRPTSGGDGWSVDTLADVGLRESPIAEVMQAIVSLRSPTLRSPYIQSVAIARHGRLVLDEYFYGFTPESPHDVRSAGKSVTTLMVGRAIEDSHRFSPQTPVLSFLPQYLPVGRDDPRKRRMTVANLMTMSSGLACDDNDENSPGNEDTMQAQTRQPDWYKYTLDLPIQYDPGSRAFYCSAGINLLGAIVSRATGLPLERYFYDRFALPMQFQRYAMWLMPPPTNAAYMAGGDYFRPRDFLKFGQLFLSHGKWNGRQILDDGWLRDSVVTRTVMNEDAAGEGDRYGYGWHLASLEINGRRYGVVNAGGNGGQIMAVVPDLDMAVMIMAGNYNQYPVWSAFLQQVVGAAIRAAT
ncbi:MAG TPA: serine hydrolase domain-containing protein [Candidatus Cybelea sp.]